MVSYLYLIIHSGKKQTAYSRMGLSLENVLDTVNMELVFNVVTAALAMAGAWVIFQDGFPM